MAGNISVITGGIVSFGPPLGGVVVLAQECEKIIDPRMIATGMAGHIADIIFFIILILLKVFPIYTFYSIDFLESPDQILKIVHIIYI